MRKILLSLILILTLTGVSQGGRYLGQFTPGHQDSLRFCFDCFDTLGHSTDATGDYLMLGVANQTAWSWTVGGLVYLSITGTTGNTLTQTAPSATDNVIQMIGIAIHANRMIVDPSLVQVEHT